MMKTSFAQRRGFGLIDGSPRVPTGWHRILVGATAASLLLISATSHAQKYTVTDLGANTTAVAINNAGQVLGRMATSTGAGFVWTNGTSQVLPANFAPTAINTSGAITGGIMSSAGTVHVGLYANGVLTDLGVLVPPGGDTSAASSEGFGINDKGQITGGLFTGLNLNVSGSYGAFLYGPDATTYLITNGGWGVSVNTSGQVAVTSYDCANQCWAGSGLIWSNGSNTIIGIGNLAEPAAINNAGEVTGCIVAAHEAMTSCISAFLYVPTSGAGAVTSIGPSDAFVSSGAAINNLGQVTGTFSGPGTASALTSSNTNPNSYHAFLYTPQSVQFANCITPGAAGANGYTAAVDLNALLQNTSSVTFTAGVGINDSGQILANGLDSNNMPHAYLLSPVPGVAPLITTYAGGANWQGSPPLSIGTDSRHVTRGPDGSIYVLDQGFYSISGSYVYRIDPASHTLTRVAGSGVPGYAGDGCPAANASFNAPEGLAFDAQGNLYIADTYNDTVRLVTADPAFQPNNPGALPGGPITENSLVTTLAITFPGADGTAQSITNPVALKMDPSGRYLYVAAATGVQVNGIVRVDTTTIAIPTKGSAAANQVQSNSVSPAVTAATGTVILGNCVLAACVGVPANGVSEPAANANLNVVALAPDGAGNLYAAISDGLMSINASGQLNWVAQNAAGNTVGCPVSEPFSKANLIIGDMAFDAQGNLIIGDTYSDLVCRVNLETSTIAPVAGLGSLTNVSEASIGTPCCGDGGPAINAGFSGAVYGVALDAAGDIYVANSFRVREIVVDQTSGLIDATSLIETAAGGGSFGNPSSGDGNPATSATLDNVNGVATDSEGNLYIADAGLIRRVDVSSRVISSVAGAYAPGCAANPQAALCNIGYTIAVTVDASGNVVFADSDSRIWRIENGNLVPWVSSGLNSPSALAVDSAGNLYIADSGDGMIKMASAGGGLTTIAGNGTQPTVPCSNSVCPGDGGLALQVPLSKPMGIAIDGSGNLYFTDSNAVRLIRNISSCVSNSSCSVSTIYVFPPADINGVMFPASGSFCDAPPAAPYGTYCVHEPMGIARDAAGNLFVADARYYNAVIELTAEAGNTSFSESVVTWPGAAHIVRGSAQPEPFYFWYGGDGGAPINARIDDPVGVAVDTLGNLYIADYGDNRVRLILLSHV
jgi:sugar lactone lactonase YvrE